MQPRIIKVIKRLVKTDEVRADYGVKQNERKFKQVTRYCVYLFEPTHIQTTRQQEIGGQEYTDELQMTLTQLKLWVIGRGYTQRAVEVFDSKGVLLMCVYANGKAIRDTE